MKPESKSVQKVLLDLRCSRRERSLENFKYGRQEGQSVYMKIHKL